MNAIDILVGARELIKKKWCQGVHDDKVCSLLAITETCKEQRYAGDLETYYEAREKLVECLPEKYEGSILRWNDEIGRTKKEVLATFDLAIQKGKP